MRFLTVSHFYESHGGGIERVAGELNRAIAENGHAVSWAASDADDVPDDALMALAPLRCFNPTEKLTGLPMPIPAPSSLAKLDKAVATADVLIIHDALYVTSLAAIAIARRRRKPAILIQHIAGIPFSSKMMRDIMAVANRYVTEPVLRAADQTMFISDTVRRDFAHVSMKRHAQLVFNGVDGAVFRPGQSTRDRLSLPQKGRVVAFVGRFVEKKGLRILEEVARNRPDTTFALAGAGPIDPSAWGLTNIKVMGRLGREGVADLFRSSDMLLLPSIGEGYPLVIQEAMACGLPVLCGKESACADPGAARWLSGVSIKLEDPVGTAKRILVSMDSIPSDLVVRSEMARYAVSNYRWQRMADEIISVARQIV